jgi:heat shock protein HslJ
MNTPARTPIFVAALALFTAATAQAQDDFEYPPLADTRWELVTIQSMDDTSWTPEDPSKYTIAFGADNSVLVRSDCNRATGSWSSERQGGLEFGVLASTMAFCGEDSLDERFRAQFEWVRSYLVRDGHLFLATMADGSIIEFRPPDEPQPVARLMGEDLESDNPEEVQAQILGRLFGDFAERQGLQPTEAEIDAYLADMDRTLKADLGDDYEGAEGLSPEEAAELRQMRGSMASGMIERWKVNKALYETYGGRVIFQQFGPEPLDAYREFLEARQAAGDFEILDEAVAEEFWRYFTDDAMHDFFPPEEAANVFDTPPWAD